MENNEKGWILSNLSNDASYLLTSMRKIYTISWWLLLPALFSFIGIISMLTNFYDNWGEGFFITGIFLWIIVIEYYKPKVKPALSKIQIRLRNKKLYKIKDSEKVTYLQKLLNEYKINSAYSLLTILLPLTITCIFSIIEGISDAFIALLITSVLVICTKYVTPIALIQKCIKNEINIQLLNR
ncbi:hypothetical protein LBAT_0116 [Lactobacillus acetotolerans]|uniref:Uncharacterized protein n=1 Tax=Lactobacillus acetotolerans TaxID=1600 RepID=A0A0D6A1U2_9LACO|nr:hypothetical protein [Lactobacillus acetotolerans]BAQ56505.1 hypothetical protein LBAT_0116 [Lactobacillus acetotolerans]